MKYLIISHLKDMLFTLPPEQQKELNSGAMAFINKYRNEGKCKDTYNVPGLNMTVSIWEVESGEELDQLFLEFPMSTFMDFEIYTLSDFDASMMGTNALLEQMIID